MAKILSTFLTPPALSLWPRPLLLVLVAGCLSDRHLPQEDESFQFQGQTMGTTYQIKFFLPPGHLSPSPTLSMALAAIKMVVEQKLQQVDQALSTYRNDSELSQINHNGSAGQTFTLGPLLRKTLQLNYRVFQQSEGFFDPSVGPLVNLWGHGPQRHQNPPSAADIARTLQLVGLDKFHFSEKFRQLRKPHPDAYLDFSASAKGLGVDEVAMALESLGIRHYLVEIGGEIRAHTTGKKPWQLAIERPQSQPHGKSGDRIQAVIPLATGALATSGNYRNYYTKNGRRYGHTIDPHSGQSSPTDLLSASVIHSTCAAADAWATALMAMGRHRAIATANRLGIPALLVVATPDGPREVAGRHWRKAIAAATSMTPTAK